MRGTQLGTHLGGLGDHLTWVKRRRAELLYTCEIGVNGRVVCQNSRLAPPMYCPTTRAGKPALTLPFFRSGSNPNRPTLRGLINRFVPSVPPQKREGFHGSYASSALYSSLLLSIPSYDSVCLCR